MTDEENEKGEKPNTQAVSKRVRRSSIFLILGVAAVLAFGTWLVTSWYSEHYYGDESPLTELPPPPPVENSTSTPGQ